jgi:hypothetical protein
MQIKKNVPNYKRLYQDILTMKYPDRIKDYQYLLSKTELSVLDVIYLNDKLFTSSNNTSCNQKYKSYDKYAIFEILDYQIKNGLNNSELSRHFKLSRNTIIKWKKLYRK